MPDTAPNTPTYDQLMDRIARQWPAVTYDSRDPHRVHIEAAATDRRLALVPSDTIQPRTIRGCPLPSRTESDVDAVAQVLHELYCADLQHATVPVDGQPDPDRTRGQLVVAKLLIAGWQLVPVAGPAAK